MDDYTWFLVTDEECPEFGGSGARWPVEKTAIVGRWNHINPDGSRELWVTRAVCHVDDAEWIARALTADEVSE